MTIKVGDTLPEATFFKVGEHGPEEIPSGEIFNGRSVVLVSVPGAFTPVCDGQHLPGYIENVAEFRKLGVDEIVCISVNDVYVMNAWSKQTGAEGKVTLLGDDGSFVKALGLTVEIPRFGLGLRGHRFSMLVKDNVVEKLNIEASSSDAGVSTAQYFLEGTTPDQFCMIPPKA